MKKWVSLFLIILTLNGWSGELGENASLPSFSDRENKKEVFQLNDIVNDVPTWYDKAQAELQKLPFAKEVDSVYHHYKHGVNVPVVIDGKRYEIPLFLSLNTSKRLIGLALESGTLLPKGKTAFSSFAVSKDGFSSGGGFYWGKHELAAQYTHQNLEQYFYTNGWESSPAVYTSSAQQDKNKSFLIGQVHKRQDDFSLSYAYQVAAHWRVLFIPTYEYYQYNKGDLDGGNHSHLATEVRYTDDLTADTSMSTLSEVSRKSKNYMLRNLPRSRFGKLAEISYQAGGSWSGSAYNIHKISVGTSLMWEQKKHHRLGLFAKAQRLFDGPFSSQVESSDLLFGLGIYDRQQRGKAGVAGGISYTYFLVRNTTGLLGLMPFFEQAYVTDGGHAYTPHGGIGGIVAYQFWHIPWPISLNFTQNLNDGSHHIGFKIGGKF